MFNNINDLSYIDQLINERYISKRKHPEFNLFIYNYTEKTQFQQVWNEATLSCRGLITDHSGTVVSRPFRKFFNLHEVVSIPFDEDYTVYEKLDGSLGISYFWAGRHWIATRGSFESTQAQEANNMLAGEYRFVPMMPGVTYLFEILYPENRIVVNYSRRQLVLLAKIITETGEEIIPAKHPGFPGPVIYGLDIANPLPVIPNSEGFVIRFSSGVRVKVKQEEYIRLHRIVTGLTRTRVWEYLSEGRNIVDLAQSLPDEFSREVLSMAADIMAEYYKTERYTMDVYHAIRSRLPIADRRGYALEFLKYKSVSAILFKLLDGKPYEDLIWRMVKPKEVVSETNNDEGITG